MPHENSKSNTWEGGGKEWSRVYLGSLQKQGGKKQENQEVNKNIFITNKFDVSEDLLEETLDKKEEGKQGGQPH